DERVMRITIRHLLDHQGGWTADPGDDLMFKPASVSKELKLARPPEAKDMVAYVLTRHLDFTPGTNTAYSNIGYCVLGRVLESAEKKPTYFEALQDLILKPLELEDVKPASTAKRDPREVWYPVSNETMRIEALDSTAGLIASAPAIGRLLHK